MTKNFLLFAALFIFAAGAFFFGGASFFLGLLSGCSISTLIILALAIEQRNKLQKRKRKMTRKEIQALPHNQRELYFYLTSSLTKIAAKIGPLRPDQIETLNELKLSFQLYTLFGKMEIKQYLVEIWEHEPELKGPYFLKILKQPNYKKYE